tara:strand:+ start:3891 stop:4475 length:585 start_codon:yes stop_codon:yes gene_type:complete
MKTKGSIIVVILLLFFSRLFASKNASTPTFEEDSPEVGSGVDGSGVNRSSVKKLDSPIVSSPLMDAETYERMYDSVQYIISPSSARPKYVAPILDSKPPKGVEPSLIYSNPVKLPLEVIKKDVEPVRVSSKRRQRPTELYKRGVQSTVQRSIKRAYVKNDNFIDLKRRVLSKSIDYPDYIINDERVLSKPGNLI